mmetsp:Transcript_18855/g.36328  ORF Transcript_18855/g.36328 Transcript_18855/m.36328 type:complete len:95 (-) Transcript_18855:656-940(-)
MLQVKRAYADTMSIPMVELHNSYGTAYVHRWCLAASVHSVLVYLQPFTGHCDGLHCSAVGILGCRCDCTMDKEPAAPALVKSCWRGEEVKEVYR